MDKIKINVLGCCVSRDTLALNSEKYDVPRYAAFISPYTILNGTKTDFSSYRAEFSDVSDFHFRNLTLDANKSALDFVKEGDAEWLVLDIADARFPILKSEKYNILLTQSNTVRDHKEFIINTLCDGVCTLIDPWNLSIDDFKLCIDKMLEEILKVYSPEQIILHEFFCVPSYKAKNRTIKPFSGAAGSLVQPANKLLLELYNYCEEKLKNCHVIKFPDNVIADSAHKWGLYPLHYCDLYYEYAEKCVSIITQKYNRKDEEKELEFLRLLYSEKFATLNANLNANEITLDRNKLLSYSTSFRHLINNNLLEYNKSFCKNIERAFLDKGYKNIAILGVTEITKVLIHIFKNSKINIAYIAEHPDKPVAGFKTLDRHANNFPLVDIMLIADLYWYDVVSAKLKTLNLPFPFCNAADFIKSLPYCEKFDISSLNAGAEEIVTLKTRVQELSKRNQQILSSKSYKVGRFITFIPRKIKNLFKK